MSEHVIADIDDIESGDCLVVEIKGREIGVYNLDGEYHAYANWCPHQGGPVCEGWVDSTREATFDRDSLEMNVEWMQEGEILMCPWHFWEFDLNSGECLSRDDVQLPSYSVTADGDQLVLEL